MHFRSWFVLVLSLQYCLFPEPQSTNSLCGNGGNGLAQKSFHQLAVGGGGLCPCGRQSSPLPSSPQSRANPVLKWWVKQMVDLKFCPLSKKSGPVQLSDCACTFGQVRSCFHASRVACLQLSTLHATTIKLNLNTNHCTCLVLPDHNPWVLPDLCSH